MGFPIGDSTSPEYIRFEIHYDNPGYKENLVDNSGFRFWITENLRKYDSNILEVGHDVLPWHIIPPGEEAFLSVGYCPSECLSEVDWLKKIPK